MEELAPVQESEVIEHAPVESQDDTNADPSNVDSPDSDAPLLETDEEEIDHDGEKYKVPKKLKDAFLRQQDYTQKTQAVAEQRKAVEAQAETIRQQAAAQQQNLAEYAEAYSLDAQIKQYKDIDWQKLITDDPQRAMLLDRQMRDLQQRRDQVVSSVTQKQHAQQLQAQQETARRLQESRAVIAREISDWSPETATALHAYGQEFGYKAEELAEVSDPRAVKLLHKAWKYDQLMKKQANLPKEKPEPQAKPVTRISATQGSAAKDPSKMSDTEFAAWRRRQIAQRP